jgi:hypothetical protein
MSGLLGGGGTGVRGIVGMPPGWAGCRNRADLALADASGGGFGFGRGDAVGRAEAFSSGEALGLGCGDGFAGGDGSTVRVASAGREGRFWLRR